MSSTSVKHQDFVGEPMGDKEITAVAGIGAVLGERLSDKGFDKVIFFSLNDFIYLQISFKNYYLKAYVLLGQFLLLKKDEELFKDWMKETCGANSHQSNNAFTCLKEWCNSYI